MPNRKTHCNFQTRSNLVLQDIIFGEETVDDKRARPVLTDLFVKQVRALQGPEKGSVLQKLKREPPEHKPAAPKKREYVFLSSYAVLCSSDFQLVIVYVHHKNPKNP